MSHSVTQFLFMQFNLFRHYLIISHIASLSLEDEPIIELVEQYIASLQFYQQLKNEFPQQPPLFLS